MQFTAGMAALLLVAASMSVSMSAGCKAAPRQTPIKLGPVDTGPGSLQAVRKQLEGSWTLVSLVTYSAAGQPRRRDATGQLTYDAYGNLTLDGRLADADDGANPNPIASFTGRAVIDTARQRIILRDVQGDVPLEKVLPEATPANARRYEFSGNELRLTVEDGSGRTTAVSTWRKIS